MSNAEWIRRAYANLKQDESRLRSMIINATEAEITGRDGGGATIELFPDGNYRGLWNYQMGSLMRHPSSVFVTIPTLSCETRDFLKGHNFTQAITELDRRVEDLINLVSQEE